MAKITITTSQAVRELKAVMQELVKLQQTSNKVGLKSAESLSKIEKQLNKIRLANLKADKSFKSLENALEKNTRANNANTAALRSQRIATNQLTKSIYKKIAADKRSAQSTKKVEKESRRLTKGLGKLIKGFGVFQGLRLFGTIVKEVFRLTKEFDSLEFTMKAVTDTTFDLASSQRFLLKISEDYGVQLLQTSQRYVKFLAAAKQSNLSLADTEKIFGSVTKASSLLGLKTDELTGVYLALEQMLSKGKVTTEELRRQLGERIPGAMGIMAAALDVSIPKLDEMLKKGEVLSADALPKFADAIELAFGVSQVEKIDNLVTAQNRLSNTWQIFVQDLSRGENALNKFFKSALDYANDLIKKLTAITASPELILQNRIIDDEKNMNALLKLESEELYEQRYGSLVNFEKRKKQLLNISLLNYNNFSKEEKQIHDKKISDLLKQEKKQQDSVNSIKKEIAKNNIKEASANYSRLKLAYDNELKLLKQYRQELEDLGEKQSKTGNFVSDLFDTKKAKATQKIKDKIDEQKKSIDKLSQSYASATATFDIYRKLLQESNVVPLPTKTKKAKKTAIDTSDLDLEIEKVKNAIKNLDHFMSLPTTTIQERIDSIKTMLNLESRLIELQYEKELRLSRKNKNKQELASEKHQQKEIDIKRKWDDKKIKMQKDFFKKGIKDISKNYEIQKNVEIQNLEEKFGSLSKKNKKAIKRFKDEEKRIHEKYNNEAILQQVEFIKTWMLTLEIHGEQRVALEKKIQELLSKLRKSYQSDEEVSWETKLDLIKDFLNEIGSIFNSVFERRLQQIDEEIKAEEEKYDKLIKLAENDEAQQKALALQREARIQQLEKKRQKEKEKQAKVEKAFAIAEIGINTAIAYSKALAQGGFVFGIPMATVVAALGALQVAAVLATPIPKYKDGIESVPENQKAMINDGGKQEFVERDGQILTTNTKNAIVQLKKNDTVYKDYNEMMLKSRVPGISSIGSTYNFNLKTEKQNLEESILKGFKKARINNTINIKNYSNNNNYKDSLTKW